MARTFESPRTTARTNTALTSFGSNGPSNIEFDITSHFAVSLSKNIIMALSGIHWDKLNSDGLPLIEILAKHNSTYAPGAQTRHPHAQMTWDGKWISYNSQFHDKSDVYVVKIT